MFWIWPFVNPDRATSVVAPLQWLILLSPPFLPPFQIHPCYTVTGEFGGWGRRRNLAYFPYFSCQVIFWCCCLLPPPSLSTLYCSGSRCCLESIPWRSFFFAHKFAVFFLLCQRNISSLLISATWMGQFVFVVERVSFSVAMFIPLLLLMSLSSWISYPHHHNPDVSSAGAAERTSGCSKDCHIPYRKPPRFKGLPYSISLSLKL